MNLQENIHRIKDMMGVINEDNRPNVFKKMIDELGITSAIKMAGNYYMIEPYLKVVDKVNFIKEKVSELGRGGISLREIGEEPIVYDDYDNDHKQIEFLGRDRAYVDIYYRGHNVGDERIPYESLSVEIIELLVETLLNH
jgi:hypothetical protein